MARQALGEAHEWRDLEAETAHPKGDPELPLSSTEIESKFEALAAFGGREGAAAPLLDWVRSISKLDRVSLPRGL